MPNNVNSNKLIETAIHVKYVENKIEIIFICPLKLKLINPKNFHKIGK